MWEYYNYWYASIYIKKNYVKSFVPISPYDYALIIDIILDFYLFISIKGLRGSSTDMLLFISIHFIDASAQVQVTLMGWPIHMNHCTLGANFGFSTFLHKLNVDFIMSILLFILELNIYGNASICREIYAQSYMQTCILNLSYIMWHCYDWRLHLLES